jgi:t-SNARE complex subunit (syntaxin)
VHLKWQLLVAFPILFLNVRKKLLLWRNRSRNSSGLFKDLSLLIVEQGSILDRIDYNCEQTVHHTEQAVQQLHGANESQKKMRSKLCMLVLCVLILVAVVALIVKLTK